MFDILEFGRISEVCLANCDMKYDNSDNEKGNPPLSLHGLHFPVRGKEYCMCTIPQTGMYIL